MRHTRHLLLSASLIAVAHPASAQTRPSPATPTSVTVEGSIPEAGPPEEPGSEIVVTGSRIAGRTVADSPVPVDVIDNEALTNSGLTETNKLLNRLVPSFNFPQPSLTDGTDSVRPATLRGLSPDQTLVLVNGKRRHISALLNLNGSVGRGSSAVDLNQLPPIAIGRIEVLRDGASSLYGSDAIAGVINVQLAKSAGVRASVTYGQYETSLEGVEQFNGVAVGPNGLPLVTTPGSSANNDFLTLTGTGRDRKRHDGETLTLATSIGLPVGPGGYLVVSGQYRDRNPTNRAGADRRRQFPTVGDPRELTFDRYSHRYGDGDSKDLNFVLNGGVELTPGVEAYAFGTYGQRDANGAGFYRRANDARNRDFAASTTSFVPFYPNGFLPLIVTDILDVSGVGGLRGSVGGFDADLSFTYGSNRLDYQVENSFNTSLGGLTSPRRFDAGGISADQRVVNLDFSRTLSVGFLSRLGVAVGGEYRDEGFKIRAGELASFVNGPFSANGAAGGSQVFPGFRPNNAVDAGRDSYAGYAEANADVSDRFTVQLAGRYERFSDFGDTLNGKVAARFEVVPGVAVRGSASTGFRAPSLAQQFFQTTSTNNVNGTLIEIGTFPVGDPVARALGSRQLTAEKSTNLGGGVTLNPVRGLNLTADYYNIEIRDRVTLTENLQGAAVVGILNAAGIRNVTSARFFVNGVDTRTQGVDVIGSYSVPEFGAGKFQLTAGYNYNSTKITDRAVLPSLPNITLFGRTESFRLTDGQPSDKINLGLDWTLDRLGATVRANRFGKVFIPGPSTDLALRQGAAPGDYTLGAKWLTDVEGRVDLVRGVQFAVGADNVFDVYPDRGPVGGAFGTNGFFLPYNSQSPFGFNGRFLYGRVSYDFR